MINGYCEHCGRGRKTNRRLNKGRNERYYNENGVFDHSKYYIENRDKYKHKCECGVTILKGNVKTHILTAKHKKKMLLSMKKNNNILPDKQESNKKTAYKVVRKRVRGVRVRDIKYYNDKIINTSSKRKPSIRQITKLKQIKKENKTINKKMIESVKKGILLY